MPDDRELFDKAEANLRQLRSQLQVNSEDLMTVFLLILAKDLGVALPAVFDGLTTNYAAFLSGAGDFNDEKLAINSYLGRVATDSQTLQYVLITKIAATRAIAGVQPVIATLPSAPYVPPQQKKTPS